MIIVDNFYDDPDQIREIAIKKFLEPDKISGENFVKGNGYGRFPGHRVFPDLPNLVDCYFSIQEKFDIKIDPRKWLFTQTTNFKDHIEMMDFDLNNMSMRIRGTDLLFNPHYQTSNGSFQYCDENSTKWIHIDKDNTYAAVVYLFPDAEDGSGTAIFQHKETGLKTSKEIFSLEETKNFDKWDIIDYAENKYNRCIVFDAKQFHSATKYFGTTPENSRLTQVFFFDIL